MNQNTLLLLKILNVITKHITNPFITKVFRCFCIINACFTFTVSNAQKLKKNAFSIKRENTLILDKSLPVIAIAPNNYTCLINDNHFINQVSFKTINCVNSIYLAIKDIFFDQDLSKVGDKKDNYTQLLSPKQLYILQSLHKRNWSLLLLTLAFILLLIQYCKECGNKQKQKLKYQLTRSTLLKSQMTPHMVFNIINDIQSTILFEDEKTINANIISYSKFIRHSLYMNTSEYVSLKEEFDYLKSYLIIKKRLLNNNLDFKIEKQADINSQKLMLPCLLIQPFVENAIKHGLLPKKNNRQVTLKSYISKNDLTIEVIDNGIGIKHSKQKSKNDNKKHYGISFVKERIKHINSAKRVKMNLNISEIVNNEKVLGTKVIVTIPTNIYKF